MKHEPTIAFFGTPELAVYVLEELRIAGITPSLVVTAPDKPAGRKLELVPPRVKVWAESDGIPVLQTATLKTREHVPELANTPWDVFIVAAYNIILPQWVLDLPRHHTLNVHPSLLPKLRGPSPIRSAILRDERDSVGVTIIKLDAEVDHGPIVAQATVELEEWPIRGSILDELLFREGGRLLAEALPLWMQGTITPEPQDHAQATFSKKFVKQDGEIDLSSDGYENWLRFCAYEGWPGSFFFVQESPVRTDLGGKQTRVRITDATYENGQFIPLRVIPEGKKETPYVVWKSSCAK